MASLCNIRFLSMSKRGKQKLGAREGAKRFKWRGEDKGTHLVLPQSFDAPSCALGKETTAMMARMDGVRGKCAIKNPEKPSVIYMYM